MPHIIVKLYPGKTEQQKADIADALTKAMMATAGSSEKSLSVSLEDIQPDDWVETVYKPEIIGKPELLYKKPGYDPLQS